MEKESFLKLITNLSPQELNKLIEEKGKKPRLIPLFKKVDEEIKKTKGE